MSGISDVLVSLVFKDPPRVDFPCVSRVHIFPLFLHSFSDIIFYNDRYQNLSKLEPQNNVKSDKSAKTHHRNAPTVRTCKKSPSGKGQASKMDDSYTLFIVFSEAPGSQKNIKIGTSMESPGTQNHKHPINKCSKKHENTEYQKNWSMAPFLSEKANPFRTGSAMKITTIPKIFKMGSRGCLEPPMSLKITILTSKTLINHCHLLNLYTLFSTLLGIMSLKNIENKNA